MFLEYYIGALNHTSSWVFLKFQSMKWHWRCLPIYQCHQTALLLDLLHPVSSSHLLRQRGREGIVHQLLQLSSKKQISFNCINLFFQLFITLFGCSIDGTRQFWMRISRFSCNDYIGSISSSFQSDSFTDSSAGPCDEKCPSCQLTLNKLNRLLRNN